MEITDYLLGLEKAAIYNLGLVLGLKRYKLKAKMNSCSFLDDVIHAWLQREDQVKKKGEPSWKVLVSALRHPRLEKTGIADRIVKEKRLLNGTQDQITLIDYFSSLLPRLFFARGGENCLFNFCSKRHVRGAPIRLFHANDVTYCNRYDGDQRWLGI